MNESQNSKQSRLGHLELGVGIYLGFRIWYLK